MSAPADHAVRAPAPRPLDRLAGVVLALAGVALVIMALVQAWQVFARYVLNDSPGWTEPLALLMMSFAVMFGAAVGVRAETHFAFQGLLHAAPTRAQVAMKTLARLIALAAGLGLAVLGGTLMVDDWGVALPGAGLPAGLRFAALCVGGVLIAVFAAERLVTGDPEPLGEED